MTSHPITGDLYYYFIISLLRFIIFPSFWYIREKHWIRIDGATRRTDRRIHPHLEMREASKNPTRMSLRISMFMWKVIRKVFFKRTLSVSNELVPELAAIRAIMHRCPRWLCFSQSLQVVSFSTLFSAAPVTLVFT